MLVVVTCFSVSVTEWKHSTRVQLLKCVHCIMFYRNQWANSYNIVLLENATIMQYCSIVQKINIKIKFC